MKRRDMLRATGAVLVGASAFPWGWVRAADQKKVPQKILYFTRCQGFVHDAVKRGKEPLAFSEKLLTALGAKHGFEVECTKDGTVFDGDLAKYDAIAFYTSGDLCKEGSEKTPPMTAAGKQKLLDAVNAGKGFIAFHAASDSFHTPGKGDENQDSPDPYIKMLGGEFIVHGRQQAARMIVASPQFPGAGKFTESPKIMEEWYTHKNFAKDLHVILVQDTAGMEDKCYQRPPYPATWARMHGKGRVFYTSFGHRDDVWTNPLVEGLILGGIAWALKNVDADVTPNLDKAAPKASQLKN